MHPEDHSATRRKVAAFVPSYCLTLDRSGLTIMSKESVINAALLIRSGEADYVILSTAYSVSEEELVFKKALLGELGIREGYILSISGVNNSYDEAMFIGGLINQYNIHRLIIVGDKYHAPRAEAVLNAIYFDQDVLVTSEPFTTPKFEQSYEPSWIKSVRAGNKYLWIIWNKLFQALNPIMIYWMKRRYNKI